MFDLSPYNTLKVSAKAKNFLEINTLEDLEKINRSEPYMFLGSGANVLFTKDFPGTVAKINLDGIAVVEETDENILIEVQSGQNWHDFVTFCVENGFSGNENMALIPGSVGAAAIGNIAAYGQDQEDIFESLIAIDLTSGKSHKFTKNDMQFAYRESSLKNNPQNLFVSTVTYRLSKSPQFSINYDAKRHQGLLSKLNQLRANRPQPDPTSEAQWDARTDLPQQNDFSSKDVYNAVIALRTEKLPDWRTTPNAGSFFKNPVITKEHFFMIRQRVPDLQAYPPEKLIQTSDENWLDSAIEIKVPAGRLLDHLGWRGKRIGNVGTHPTQALCVVNYGATGYEIYAFTESMRQDMKSHYNIDLEYEVQIR